MNAVTRIIPDITTMIRMDHSHVLALFHRYKAHTSPNKKRALVRNACLAIEVHAQLEEEIFYPALRTVISGDEVLDKSEPEHNEMRRFIRELRELTEVEAGPTDEMFDDKFHDLIRSVMHHVADEETHLLPVAERSLGERLNELGVAMTRRRLELLKPHAGELAASTARSFPAGAAAGAALLTAGAVAVGAMLLYRGKSTGGKARRVHH
ncbi:MAG TPA: hemerythrin domain-containing protein [Steroidobacteraceae bacterium]|nr:hemerythrin domain-containing protein [Steroidobacteraceae bacterium]